jgi:hypothetical protein
MESLQQPETFACHENSNAIALTMERSKLDHSMTLPFDL